MRDCGTCSACCTALAVHKLDKPTYTPCVHQCGDGCGIYNQRPGACRDFQCLWLQGHLGEEDRPDKLGVIFCATDHPDVGRATMLVECADGALQANAIRHAITRLATKTPVVLMSKTGGSIVPKRAARGATPVD